MSGEALKRYKLLDHVCGEAVGVTPRLVHDFRKGYQIVDADDAAREIEWLEAELKDMILAHNHWRMQGRQFEADLVSSEATITAQGNTIAQYQKQIERLEARVQELQHELDGLSDVCKDYREERDRLLGLLEKMLEIPSEEVRAVLTAFLRERATVDSPAPPE